MMKDWYPVLRATVKSFTMSVTEKFLIKSRDYLLRAWPVADNQANREPIIRSRMLTAKIHSCGRSVTIVLCYPHVGLDLDKACSLH